MATRTGPLPVAPPSGPTQCDASPASTDDPYFPFRVGEGGATFPLLEVDGVPGPAGPRRPPSPSGSPTLPMTASSREVIDRLRALQDLDARLARLDREIHDGPKAVETYLRAVAAVDARLAQIEERNKLLRAQAKIRENETKVAEGKVEKLNQQASEVKTNREFTAIRSEIANAKLEVGRIEDEILKIMEAVEQQDKLDGRRARGARPRVEEVRGGEGEGRRRHRRAPRPSRRAGEGAARRSRRTSPPPPSRIYERVLQARGNAVVPLEQDFCSGCLERLTRNDCLAILNAARHGAVQVLLADPVRRDVVAAKQDLTTRAACPAGAERAREGAAAIVRVRDASAPAGRDALRASAALARRRTRDRRDGLAAPGAPPPRVVRGRTALPPGHPRSADPRRVDLRRRPLRPFVAGPSSRGRSRPTGDRGSPAR